LQRNADERFSTASQKEVTVDEKGRILIFTGDGKGKTTAALGMALRAHGHGIPIAVIQFVKNDIETGEYAALNRLSGVDLSVTGRGFVPPRDNPVWQEHRQAAEEGLRIAGEAVRSGRYGLVILDEGCYAVARQLIPEEAVLQLLKEAPPSVTIVLTGRGATEGLIAAADTVSEIRCVKHGFDSGRKAQKGVEF
jgi:cob(I)alamin adenosyltransferase